jgi:hypothetical protein
MVLFPPQKIDPSPPMQPRATSKRQSVLNKQSHLIQKHGKRHHTFDKEKAPYPQSYDRQFMELYVTVSIFALTCAYYLASMRDKMS